jgi:heptosyltransferase-3
VLIVATQRLGDVLLTTPLIRSVRLAWPQATLHALVFDDTRSVLEANADVDAILTVPRHPGLLAHLRLAKRLWRRYDLAVSTGTGDRPTLYAWLAGRRRIGFTLPGPQQAWKRRLLHGGVEFDDLGTHTVAMNLRLADALGIARSREVTLAWSEADAVRVSQALGADAAPYAVLHMSAKFKYKNWHAEGWTELAAWLIARGLRVVFTGSNEPAERAAIEAALQRLPARSAAALTDLSLPQVGCLLAGAALVVGPDTVVTHAAAAAGVPTIALFGPSNPVKWGPWPQGAGTDPSPYRLRGSQTVGRVILLQGEGPCVPCRREGCDRHTGSSSRCLQELSAQRVIAAADRLLDPVSPPRAAAAEAVNAEV